MKKAFVILLVSLFVASCGQKVEKQIIGKWAVVGNLSETIEFFEDNTFKSGGGAGTWKLSKDGWLEQHYSGGGITAVEGFHVSETAMSWLLDARNADGESWKLRKTFVRVE